MIRIYGETRGTGSFVEVTRGLCEAAKATGVFAGLFPVDEADFYDERPGATAAVGLVCGAPGVGVSNAMALGLHKELWLMLAPNSDRVPEGLAEWIPRSVHGLVAPSSWAAEVLHVQFPSLLVEVCPHGVSGFSPNPSSRVEALTTFRMGGALRILHFTSTNMQRKGTRELVEGFEMAQKEGLRATLTLIVPDRSLAYYEQMVGGGEIEVLPHLKTTRQRLAEFMGAAHLIAQPSRAEGFGIVPLEARALGVPVLATACTGHTEHFPFTNEQAAPWGCVVVPHGAVGAIDDCSGAFAPTVSPEAIAESLKIAERDYAELARAALERAPEVAEAWSWEKKSGPALVRLAEGKTG